MFKNKSLNIFKNQKNKNQKITIESKDKNNYKSFYNGNKNLISSPLRAKNIFSVSKSKKNKKKKFKLLKDTKILYNMNRIVPVIDKEGLVMEILQFRNEIELMDFEIYKLKRRKKKLEQKFLANKLIIEGILNIPNDKESKSNELFITQNKKENVKIDENYLKEDDINNKTENNYYNGNKKHVIICLKKQILNCNKNIEDKNKLMEIKKNNNIVNNFLKLNSSIDNKNKRLEELVNKSQTLQYVILDIEARIEYFTVKIKNYIDETIRLDEIISNNDIKMSKTNKEIDNLYLEREELLRKIKILQQDDKNFNNANHQKKEEKKFVENELKTVENIKNEKDEKEHEFNDINRKENIIKNIIEKNEKIISGMSHRNNYIETRIEEYLKERPLLIEKSKIRKKSKDKMKKLENDISKIKNINEENKKAVNDHNKIKSQLIKKINQLSEELKKKHEEFTNIGEELDNIKNEYDIQIPKEYRILDNKNEEENYENEFKDSKNENKKKEKKGCIIF